MKKIQLLSFSDKTKLIKSQIPKKVKIYIDKNFSDELSYFQKKYSIKIDLIGDDTLIIPEYKIQLLNKSKKVINVIESINYIDEIKLKKTINLKPTNKKEVKKVKKDLKKNKNKKILRTLWVRRKRKSN